MKPPGVEMSAGDVTSASDAALPADVGREEREVPAVVQYSYRSLTN